MANPEFNQFTAPPSGEYSRSGARALRKDLKSIGRGHDFQGDENKHTLYPYVREITDILMRCPPANFTGYDPIKPIAEALRMPIPPGVSSLGQNWNWETKREYLAFALSFMRRREYLIRSLEQAFGAPRVFVQLEGVPALELALYDGAQEGGNRFFLLDSRAYYHGTRLHIGTIAVDYPNPDILIINELFGDEGRIVEIKSTDFGTIDDDEEWFHVDKGAAIAAQSNIEDPWLTRGQEIVNDLTGAIQQTTQRGRTIQPDAYTIAIPAIEELLIYSALHTLLRAGVLRPDARVIIPKAELTQYPSWMASKQTRLAVLNDIFRELSDSDRNHIKDMVFSYKEMLNPQWGQVKGDESEQLVLLFEPGEALLDLANNYVESQKGITSRSSKREAEMFPAPPQFVANLVLRRVSDQLQPTEEELEQFGYYNNFWGDRKTFEDFMSAIAARTNDYLEEFHRYRTVFSDVMGVEHTSFGRIIPVQAINALPFTQNVRIEPSKV